MISNIYCAEDTITSYPSTIPQEFTKYFTQLYEAVPGPSGYAIQEALNNLDLPTLSPEEAALFDRTITLDEI